MASSKMLKAICLIAMCMAILAPHASAAVSCNSIYSNLYPCMDYVQHGGPIPSACCNGVKSLLASARTKSDRQGVCSCLKTAAGAFPGIGLTYASTLPSKCGVNIPYKINPNIDCSKVN